MKLHYHPLSGNAHRARLFLSLLGVPHDLVEVDLMAGAHKQPDFLALNPFGQVPVLEDGDVVIPDSTAILVYLAKKHGGGWLPEDAQGAAAVQRWLAVATGELAYGPAAARLVTLFGAKLNADEVITRAHLLLTRLEAYLDGRDWLVGTRPSIADIALYSYLYSAPEGNVDLSAYPHVRAFLTRIEGLPGFVPFARNKVGLAV
ncbi:glutathione S-transferase [Niveispirillum lacus]|uniref:Glutathione S-transferase n=1 Tax=Niveispirillum lacus TaxID=1981099 RepID=A0A255YRH5_9PROT|nr:glutathione S-transferase [Niveispirillum lacus]OYQ31809.1 glutathione S-transferase [Niveispirillum lacus]